MLFSFPKEQVTRNVPLNSANLVVIPPVKKRGKGKGKKGRGKGGGKKGKGKAKGKKGGKYLKGKGMTGRGKSTGIPLVAEKNLETSEPDSLAEDEVICCDDDDDLKTSEHDLFANGFGTPQKEGSEAHAAADMDSPISSDTLHAAPGKVHVDNPRHGLSMALSPRFPCLVLALTRLCRRNFVGESGASHNASGK